MPTGRRALLAGLAALACSTALSTTVLTAPGTAVAATPPCGALAGSYDPQYPPQYQHVVVLMEENLSYAHFLSTSSAPYLRSLASGCGSETNIHAATHPSQPNYMAATSGIATAVGVHTANDNVFSQVQAAGTWASYEESMPKNCSSSSNGLYKPGHNPPFWYTDLWTPSNTCALDDVPLSPALTAAIQADALPAYSWITPNYCHDFHWSSACSGPYSARIKAGDDWLSGVVPQLTGMPSFQAGRTLLLITFDEGEGGTKGVDCTNPAYYPQHPDCHIPTVVVSAYLAPGSTDGSDQNLYSLLGTTEDILGVARLGRAAGQPSMRPGLRF